MKFFLLSAITIIGLSMCSQNKQGAVTDEVYDSCAVMPEFPGGQEALMAFIGENIKYPVHAEEVGMEGRVVCSFIIEKDGSVSNVEVVESADSLLDSEALRVMNLLSEWTPGRNEKGEAVRVRYKVPVKFELDGAHEDIEQMAEFPGGLEAFVTFISENVKYPPECEEKGIEGRVLIDIVIDENGNVTDVKVKKSVDPQLDAEALRVVKLMPKWNPGMDKGKPIKVNYTVPFTFRLK
ncbi:energy transducer TonB [Prevotella sp. E9-3]|uniref:energy transducer TonB n=1 Tax=Prevotella sp. E9-3 TaxID=2913621 RepID=UPI001EDA22FD|nr:energy transducer TonB [Prevotella sp. E9-3]UKK47774.1 energy transducer TonB [Prevotella sp. E9-3]